MKYTIVYVSDDGYPTCYGTFPSRAAAEKHRERMERSLDNGRDLAGGGVGNAFVCVIAPLMAWQA